MSLVACHFVPHLIHAVLVIIEESSYFRNLLLRNHISVEVLCGGVDVWTRRVVRWGPLKLTTWSVTTGLSIYFQYGLSINCSLTWTALSFDLKEFIKLIGLVLCLACQIVVECKKIIKSAIEKDWRKKLWLHHLSLNVCFNETSHKI